MNLLAQVHSLVNGVSTIKQGIHRHTDIRRNNVLKQVVNINSTMMASSTYLDFERFLLDGGISLGNEHQRTQNHHSHR